MTASGEMGVHSNTLVHTSIHATAGERQVDECWNDLMFADTAFLVLPTDFGWGTVQMIHSHSLHDVYLPIIVSPPCSLLPHMIRYLLLQFM
jgi:hypothetical protein